MSTKIEQQSKISNFYEGSQHSLLKTPSQIVFERKISQSGWRNASSSDRAKVRLAANEYFQLLGVQGMRDIPQLLQDPQEQAKRSAETSRRLGKMWGIEGNEEEVRGKIEGFGKLANRTRSMVEAQLPPDMAEIGMVNKIQATNDPFRLGLIIVDDRYDQKARFEAQQKLILMRLAGAIDQREREMNISQKYSQFNDFLEEHVWSSKMKIGETDLVYFLSTHDPKTLECSDVTVLNPQQRQDLKLRPNQIITPLRRRRIELDGKEIPVYATLREKTPESKILKLLRKGSNNPAEAVDDELGLMAVFDNKSDVKRFTQHLGKSASQGVDTMLLFEDVEDSLNGGMHAPKSPGSSPYVEMYKFHARWGGMRTENILLTNTGYLNYLYRDGVSHEEFELRRLFDAGVIEFLYPSSICNYNPEEMREQALNRSRRITRASINLL